MDLGAVFTHRLAVDGQRLLVDELALHELVNDSRDAARAVIFFAKVFPSRLHVHKQRHLVCDRLPILNRKRHADAESDRVDVERRGCGAPPMALLTTILFSNASRVKMSDGFRSSHTISTIRWPVR